MMRTITVRGVGNVSARPDYITISMTIESIRKDYDEAMKEALRRNFPRADQVPPIAANLH